MSRFEELIRKRQQAGWSFPKQAPEPGEITVQGTFSQEWADYDYDGVIWSWTEQDRLEMCLREIGLPRQELPGKKLVDVGCGNAVLTNAAARDAGLEAVGVDLSFAPVRASRQFRENPFLHLIQGSVFHLPLQPGLFDIGYSSGVLHHTWNTKLAFENAVRLVRPGGTFYVWLYSAERHGIQGAISLTNDLIRQMVCRLPSALQNMAVYMLTPIFWGVRGALRSRLFGTATFPYDWKKALHATRDAYTPRYAYHHTRREVIGWFEKAGFKQMEALNLQPESKSTSVPVSVRAIARG